MQNVPLERFVSNQLVPPVESAKGLRRSTTDVWSAQSAERAMQAPAAGEPSMSMGEYMSALTRNSSGASVPGAGKASAANSNASLLSFLDMESLFLPSTLDSSRLAEDLFADPNFLQGFAQASAGASQNPVACALSSSESLVSHAPALGAMGGAPIDNELRDQLARVAREELIDLTESDFTVATPSQVVAPAAHQQAGFGAPPPSLATPPSTPISMQTSQAIIDGLSVATLLVDPKGSGSILDDLVKGATRRRSCTLDTFAELHPVYSQENIVHSENIVHLEIEQSHSGCNFCLNVSLNE